jgi:hypothetical protein
VVVTLSPVIRDAIANFGQASNVGGVALCRFRVVKWAGKEMETKFLVMRGMVVFGVELGPNGAGG